MQYFFCFRNAAKDVLSLKQIFSIVEIQQHLDEEGSEKLADTRFCEFFLQGENVINEHAQYKAYFCLTTNPLVKKNNNHQYPPGSKHTGLSDIPSQAQYFLQLHNPRKRLTLHRLPPAIADSATATVVDKSQKSHNLSAHSIDVMLLEVSASELQMDGPEIISLADLQKSMTCNQSGYKVGPIFPLETSEDLRQMALYEVRIKIGHSNGYMVLPSDKYKYGGLANSLLFVTEQ